MRKVAPIVRYIEPASIEIGDTIKVIFKNGDVEVTKVGTVKEREFIGQARILYSRAGVELLHWVPGQQHAKVILLDRPVVQHATLFDLVERSM